MRKLIQINHLSRNILDDKPINPQLFEIETRGEIKCGYFYFNKIISSYATSNVIDVNVIRSEATSSPNVMWLIIKKKRCDCCSLWFKREKNTHCLDRSRCENSRNTTLGDAIELNLKNKHINNRAKIRSNWLWPNDNVTAYYIYQLNWKWCSYTNLYRKCGS